MFEVIPKGGFATTYVLPGEGTPLAELRWHWWREAGELVIHGFRYSISREGIFGPFLLQAQGETLARATKTSAWLRAFVIDYQGEEYTLKAPSAWQRAFVLMHGDQVVGTVCPKSAWSRAALVDMPDLPLPLTLFLTWLVLLLWRRQAAAAAAGAAGASAQ